MASIQVWYGTLVEAKASPETEPGFLFDAMALVDGVNAIAVLAQDKKLIDFVKDQHRHGKTILAIGSAKALLINAGVSLKLPGGSKDPGIIVDYEFASGIQAFISGVARHRHPEREMGL